MILYFRIGMNCLKWPDRESFKGWFELFITGVPTYLLQIFSFLSIEAVILITGYVSTEILVANVAFINMYYLIALFTVSLQIVASALIGNKVGEQDLEGTKNMIKATVIISVTMNFVSQIIFYLCSWKFTNQEMLIIYPIVSITIIVQAFCSLLITILIGLGLQKGTVLANILSYLILGFPVSFYLTFKAKWIYYGPWIGLALATLSN